MSFRLFLKFERSIIAASIEVVRLGKSHSDKSLNPNSAALT